uniref:Uncharacterized protein n=1 Tax=Ciona savignyi TaxID=51511 RepID=H2ZR60_CIOSA
MNNNSKPKPKMSKTLNGPMSGVNNSVLQPPKSYAFQSRINKENHSAKLKKRKSVENDLRNSKRLREEIPALQILKSQAGTNARKAARRSVSNALKITRNAAIKRASPKHLSIRKPLSGTGARTNTGRPPLKPRVSPNSSLSSTHSTSNKITLSQSTSRASTDGKKTKRKAWDVKGQLDDAKEEIKAYKQKESLLSDILMRLGVLESEKERVMEEKMTMSTDVTRYQQNLDASNLEIQQLKAKLQDKTTECEQLERKFHMLVE